jgi:hypothetical protein
MILSLKLIVMTSVWTPFTNPATCFVAAGKGRTRDSCKALTSNGAAIIMKGLLFLYAKSRVDRRYVVRQVCLSGSKAVRHFPTANSAVLHRLDFFPATKNN